MGKKENKHESQYFIENCKSISVVHLCHKHTDQENDIGYLPALDYHLHILSFLNETSKCCGSLMLDTDDFFTLPVLQKDNDDVFEETILDLSQLFIDKI